MDKIFVFAGPSLPPVLDSGWTELLTGCELKPPAQRGDLLLSLAENPDAIVLLDGVYYNVPSVTHKEILYAVSSGVQVVGGASLGALRASELHMFGMTGIGQVFRWYRDGVIDGDDEVAIMHSTREFGYRPATLALVDLRHALKLLVMQGSLASELAIEIVSAVKELPFIHRDFLRVEQIVKSSDPHIEEETLHYLLRHSLKQTDAAETLRAVRSPKDSPPPRRSLPQVTVFVNFYRERYLGSTRLQQPGHRDTSFLKAWQTVQVLHPTVMELVRNIRVRFLVESAARYEGLVPKQERIEELRRQLEATQRGNPPRLPWAEIAEEAESLCLAEEGLRVFGGVTHAAQRVAAALGIGTRDSVNELLALLESQDDLLPPWRLARTFVFSRALRPALALADATEEIFLGFLEWAGDKRLVDEDLLVMASRLWGRPRDELKIEAARRGLFPSHGFSPGLMQVLAWIGPAELLTRPLNDYQDRKQELRTVALEDPFLRGPGDH